MWPRSSPAAHCLTLILLGVLGLETSRAGAERPTLVDLKWLDPDADAVANLTTAPAECLGEPSSLISGVGPPPDVDRARRARLGRVAFRSPVLLGGLAARVGISCDTCHRNGHDNPSFHFPGVSGAPGTADVTGAVFSTTRDDGRENPVPIPSLVDAALQPPFGTVLPERDLRSFILTAVVEEFQGEKPSASVTDGLVAYVSALEGKDCPEPLERDVTYASDVTDLLESFDVLVESVERGDRVAGRFVLDSLRAALERVYRRFPAQISTRNELIVRSRSLARLGTRIETTALAETLVLLAAERVQFEETLRRLEAHEEDSFYSPGVLRRALESTP